MSPDKEKYLTTTYPKLFPPRHDPRESLMVFGFECGDGWFWIIDQLCAMIQWKIDQEFENYNRKVSYNKMIADAQAGNTDDLDKYFEFIADLKQRAERKAAALNAGLTDIKDEDKPYQPEVIQVKEKYGTLRFYISASSSEIHNYIAFAEHLSATTCEFCGSHENIKTSQGWMITACDKCIQSHESLKNRSWK
jgi:hypothetical protein